MRSTLTSFDAVTFRLPECAAIDNVNFNTTTVVPEPAATTLLLATLPAIALWRRRR